jgi:hypothetical protein
MYIGVLQHGMRQSFEQCFQHCERLAIINIVSTSSLQVDNALNEDNKL